MRRLNLKVNARHISQLGRELVTDFVTALVELVKNSYDADSPAVKINFENVTTANGKIIIVDSGTGMTQQDVDEKWTVIGTNNKVRNSHSPKGRKYAGKKGIGRFSVERLAEKVVMYSFSSKEEPFKFTINWNKYEEIDSLAMKQRLQRLLHNPNDAESAKFVHGHIDYFLNNDNVSKEDKNYLVSNFLNGYNTNYTYFNNNELLIKKLLIEFIPLLEKYQSEEIRIQDIFHELEYLNEEEKQLYKNMIDDLRKQVDLTAQNETTGLVMVLEGLRDQWKQKELIKVQKELRLLVAPNFLQDDAFIPILNASEFQLEDEVIVNDILDLKYAKIRAGVVDNGNAIQINYQDKINKAPVLERLVQNPPLVCGELDVELYYFVRDIENLTSKELNVRHARQILDQFYGIKIYRDGFHIKPYGDIGNDWLLLDQNKVKDTHGYLVGNNQVVGIVNISEENNPLLIDATNREGIIENDAFNDLKKFVGECTKYISEQRRIEYEKEKKRKNEYEKLISKKRKKKKKGEKKKS
ncbi:ATP-binding protein [Bacillus cereus]|uniref:ATP-binding protein n=1 Tax=Bacillus cereus TaxID=1396 RepID=UPI000300D3F3